MKKLFTPILWLLLIGVAQNLPAQTVVQIGTGTSTSVTYGPFFRTTSTSTVYQSNKTIQFTEAELNAVGIFQGDIISDLKFYKTDANTFSNGATATVTLYARNAGTLSNYASGANVLTYQTANFPTALATVNYNTTSNNIPGANTWVGFSGLNYTYTGGTLEFYIRLLITPGSGSASTGGFSWQYGTSTSPDNRYQYSNVAPTTSTTFTTTTIRPNTQFTFTQAPCVSPPTPGDVVISNPSPCSGYPVRFTLNNNSTGIGQTYVWEYAASATGPFTAISTSLSTDTFVHSPTASGYYRAVVSCGAGTAYSDTIPIVIPGLFPAGTYTINGATPTGGTNFKTFADAANAIKCGTTGPVIFNVSPGNYVNDHFWLDSIGSSVTNTITVNGNGATLSDTATTSNFAVVRLNKSEYVTINNLTIKTTGALGGFGVLFTNQANNNTISNCTILTDTTTTNIYAGIAFSGALNDYNIAGNNGSNNTITGNTIIGGYYNIIAYADPATAGTGNVFTNNTLLDAYSYSFYLYGNTNATVASNNMYKPTRDNVSTGGVFISNCAGGTIMDKNRIHNLFDGELQNTAACYPIYFTASDGTSANPNIISNNLIYNINNREGTIYGLYNSNSDYCHYYHNTVVLDDATVITSEITRGFYQTGTATGIDVKNNIIVVQRSGLGTNHGIYFGTAATTWTANYNDYFVGGATTNALGYSTTSHTNLSAWSTATGQDLNSYDINPTFSNSASGNYTPFAALIDNVGSFVGITTDIMNATRSVSTPDIGAYEFFVPVCTTPPVAGTTVINPTKLCSGGNVSFNLLGNSTGVGQTYTWESSSNPNGPFAPVSSASSSSTFSGPVSASEYYRCAVTCGSSTTYSDTVLVNAYQPLSGNYTVNSNLATGGTNFQSFADMNVALNCGLSGPVVINVAPGSGPYNERIEFPAALNTTAANTLTINGNGAWLMNPATVSAQRAGVLINGHNHITIDSLNVDLRGGTYGFGIHLINDADSNVISRCTIICDTASTVSNYMGIALGGSATSYSTAGDNNYVVIEKNTIIGGYYGIVSYGGSSEIAVNTIIRNNNIKETYYDGIYLYYNSNPTVQGNDISRPQRSTQITAAGISLSTCSGGGLIDGNKVHNLRGGAPTSTTDCYGIELASTDGTSVLPYIVSNNLIYDMTGNGDIYGLYNTGSDYAQYYFNTISLDNTASTTTVTTKGLYQASTAVSGLEFKNNIVTITRGGTGAKHGVHFNLAATVTNGVVLDNNVYYINGAAGSNYIGAQVSTNYTTLANWQNSFTPSQEIASMEIDPLYTNTASGDYKPSRIIINNIGTPITNVTTDINGTVRSVSTPDPGAYEWTPPPCITPPTAGSSTVSDSIVCTGASTTFDLVGNSIGFPQTYQWQVATTQAGPYTNVGSASAASVYTTAITTTGYYRCAVTCGASTSYSDTIRVVAKTALAGGTYTVNSALPTSGANFNSLQEAVDAMECGITGPVVINVASGSGPYTNQQLVFPASLVTSSTNTITINGNGATLVSNSQDANQRAAIAFYGTDYVTINNLVIDASTGTYNWGIHFTQQADHNKISGCTIISSKTSTTAANASAIVFSGSNTATTTQANNGNYDTIINNTIIGGYYGIAMYGAAATPLAGNVIANNVSQDAYAYNILVVYNDGTIVRDNDVSRPSRTNSTTFAGIYVNNPSTNIVVERNRIHNIADKISASFTAYLLYINAADGTSAGPNVIRNNAVYNVNGLGARFGIRNAGSDYWSIYHNTIAIDDPTSNTTDAHGIFQVTAATNFDIKNNIISVTRPTTGLNSGININTATTTYTSDYNDVFIGNGGTNNFGLVGTTAYPTMSSWRTATTQDLNSDTLQPFYTNMAIGDLKPTNPLMDNQGTPIAGITTDIVNAARSATTPDYGAFEFVPPVCPPPVQLTASNVTASSGTITWAYVNNNPPALGYQYYYSTNSSTPASNVSASGSGTTGTTTNITGLATGSLYYVWLRSICSAADTSAWSQPVQLKTQPANDSARNAILLPVGTTVCNGINFNGDVRGATAEPGEPVISCEQRTTATTSVWYKFDAPASGMVKISTDYMISAYDSLTDGKIGVYSVTDSSNFSTFQIVGCDEDNGIIGDGWRNILYLADLTPGSRYYIKVDKNDAANPDAAFCIDVMPMTSSMISTNANCAGTGYANNSNWHNGKQAWVSMLDNNGLLIYNMKTNANTTALGAMPNKFYEQSGTSRLYNGTPYLNRNFEITSATAPASPVTLQFFFTDADYNSLLAAKPGLTMNDLNVTRLSGATCANTFNPASQTVSLLTQLANGSANGVRFINVSTPGFSGFFIHADNYPLFIRLEKITAVNMGTKNRVDWNTAQEETGDRFELERSLDGRTFTKIADIQAKGTPSQYSYMDEEAKKGVNYYRLKMFDAANKFQYSPVVKAIVNGEGVFVVEAYPNPVGETLTVKTTGAQGKNATIQVLDMTGKLLQQITMTGSEQRINMAALAGGVYLIKYTDDLHSETIRMTKE